MNKGLLKIALLSMVCASMPAAITSCKDYDDDIDNLQGQDKDLQAQITAIQAAVESLKSQAQEALTNANNAAAAAKAAQDAAEAAAAEAKAAKEYATSAAANAKAEALAEIAEQLKGYTTKAEYDALQARVKALEEKLAQGGTTTPGTSYDEALQALQTQLDALNQYKALLENLAGKEAFLNGLDQTVTEINSAIAGLQNQATNFDELLTAISNKVASIEGALVTINGDQLRSLVFNPVFYYHGIEAMWAPTFAYAQLDVKTVNADGDFATDAPVKGDSVYVTPDLVATYHMNPSTAQMPADVKAYSFSNTIKDVAFERGSWPTPTIYKAEVKDGDVTVTANLKDGILPYIATDKKVTVLALEVSLGDTVITSDYAALKPLYTTGFELADARMADHQKHLYTTMSDAIANGPFATVAWNSEGVNIAEWVDTHYKLVADQPVEGQDSRWDVNATKETVREKGFTYEYALVGYMLGSNKTSESAHAALKVDGYNCIFRPQMTQDGKQQAFGSAQGMASIDRLPIVRVALKDTISGKYAAVGYMKIQIVPDTKEDEYTIIDPFTFDNVYTAACPLQTFNESLTWWQVEEKIIEKLGISKQEFEEQYEPDYVATKDQMTGAPVPTYLLKQFDKADKGAQEIAKANWIGEVGKTEYDQASSETNVIKWNIGGEQAYNIFVDQKQTSTKVIVRFVKTYNVSMGSNNVQTVHHYVYVTLNWTPKALNVTPSGTISDNLKIAEMWYTAWTNQHGGFDETHLNVAVPKTETATADDCTFESHLLYPWKQEMKLAVSEIAEVYLPGYADANLTKTFSFKSEQAVTTATGVSGAEYVITVEGQTLYAALKSAPTAKQAIAIINNPTTSYTTWGTDDPTVEYQQTAFAKDILNAYSHTQLAKGETPTGTIQITAVNKCNKPIALTNNVFNVRFLRPINMDIKDGASMIDALNKGAVVDFADYISFTDWRSDDPMSFFSTHPWYYTYYGLQSFTIGKIDPTNPSNILNPVTSGSLKNVVTTTLGGGTLGTTTLSSVTPNMDIIFTPATGKLGNYNMGTLTYYNNGENINKAFQIEVPLVLTYKWGYLAGKMVITVNPTPGQGN